MDPQQSPPKSAIPRRGPPLTAIRTDIAQQQHQAQESHQQSQQRTRPVLQKPRPQRLRPAESVANQSQQNVPLQSEPAKRQTSKTSLRNLFARNKALRDEKKQEVTLPAVGERRDSTTPSTHVPDTPRSIAHTVASTSTLPSSSQVPTPTESTFKTEKPSRTKAKAEPKSKVSASWMPPPLFQAYPQATKYARLSIPNISADSILRIHAAQGSNLSKQGEPDGLDFEAGKNKKEARDKKTNKRGGSSALDQIVLLRKIFVLVTAGYLLQYSGEGNFDRLPEKVMRLGSTSAAFASDAIPGKPYVVQISQKSTDDGKAPATSGRTFLSRFGLQGAESRRTVRTFLVIMANPQEMNAWLVTLRKTIESLGGKKYVPEDESEGPEFPGSLHLTSRSSRLLASRKPSLKDSNPPSPSSDTFQLRSPAPSVHRKNSYQDEISIKASNRHSITAQSDALSISTTTTAFAESDVIFENPRNPTIPSHRIKITPSATPTRTPPPAITNIQIPAPASRQLRKPTSSPSMTGNANANRRSLIYSSATQSDRQVEPARRPSLGRPLSFARNDPENSAASAQNSGVPRSGSRLSMLRKNSTPTISSDGKDSRRTSVLESPPLTSSDVQEKPSPKIEAGSDSTSTTRVKRQSLVSPSQGATLTGIGIRIPPRKYSLTGSDSNGTTTSRYNRPSKSPDLGSTSRMPQTLPQQSQSRLPAVPPKGGRPLNRLPKLSPTEPEVSASPASNLARFALGNDRATKALPPVSAASTREAPSRGVPALNQARKITSTATATTRITTTSTNTNTSTNVNSGSDEQQQHQQKPAPISKTPTPASSPQTPATPREESSRRSSLIMLQSQQTSPRQRRIQNLSLLPPAPPPNCPLPEVPANLAFRLTQKRPQQSQSQSQSSSSQQQTHLPRPSMSSTLSTPSSMPPPRPSSTTPNAHIRRRSSELRRLHQQMANILNRKHSDISIPTASSSSAAAAIADPSLNTNANTNTDPNTDPNTDSKPHPL